MYPQLTVVIIALNNTINAIERMITAQEQHKRQAQSLLQEKQRLFSHILEATKAEPNEVQRAHGLLSFSPSGPPSLQENIAQQHLLLNFMAKPC